jgi:hypothetical protein
MFSTAQDKVGKRKRWRGLASRAENHSTFSGETAWQKGLAVKLQGGNGEGEPAGMAKVNLQEWQK